MNNHPPSLNIKRGKVCHSGLFTLLPLRHFGTIKHVSALYIQQARDDIITINISLPHYALKMNVHFSVNLLYHIKRVF